jgi:predicted TIM-barrel fold metal-dependent hydrolase
MEICGSLNNTLSIEEITELVDEDRIVYGSDMVDLDPRYDFGRVVFSTLTDEVKRKILGGHFLRLLEGSSMGVITQTNK